MKELRNLVQPQQEKVFKAEEVEAGETSSAKQQESKVYKLGMCQRDSQLKRGERSKANQKKRSRSGPLRPLEGK